MKNTIFVAFNTDYFRFNQMDKNINMIELIDDLKSSMQTEINNPKALHFATVQNELEEMLQEEREDYVRDRLNENHIREYCGIEYQEKNKEYDIKKQEFEEEFGKYKIFKVTLKAIETKNV